MKNIIFYFSDQQRADTCGCYGQPLNITPNLDKLAEEGTLFQHAFTPQPVCGPCRSIFQSGLYPTQTGCFRNDIALPKSVKTVANYLEEQNYETAYIGKWHLASETKDDGTKVQDYATVAVPEHLRGGYSGFWRASDILEFTSHGYDGFVFDENNNKIDFEGYRTDKITDMALEFFDKRDKSKPFFMTISHIEPHHQNDRGHYEGPNGSKEEFKNFSLPGDLEALGGNAKEEYADYLGACHSLDKNLGKLIQKLKDENLYDDTIIIYSSDHGSHFKTRNKDAHLTGADDYKRSCHDASLHVPLIICGGKFKHHVVSDIVSTASIPKTILALAGVDVGEKMIGENLENLIEHHDENRRNEAFVQISESRVGRCLRTEKWTYSVYAPNINGYAQAQAELYADDFLYDLEKDPCQLHNVVEDPKYRAIKEELRARLLWWIEKYEHYVPTIVDHA